VESPFSSEEESSESSLDVELAESSFDEELSESSFDVEFSSPLEVEFVVSFKVESEEILESSSSSS